MARRYGGIGHIVGDLGGAAPEPGPGIAMQDIAGDTDDDLDQWPPLVPATAAAARNISAVLVSCRPRPVVTSVSLLVGLREAQTASTFCSREG